MRLHFSALLLAAAGMLLTSCSNDGLTKADGIASKGIAGIKDTFTRDHIGGYTRADIANLRMRDLNPLANTPPVVPVRQSTLREIPKERMAFFQKFSWFGHKPVDYNPPTLPDGALAFDGSLLPAKNASRTAEPDGDEVGPGAAIAATGQDNANNFSIE